ncbi:TPA: restriction endonuclease subunit S [Photobacterium damselae]
MSEQMNVPKLRFGEFYAPWQLEPLSSYLMEHKEKTSAKTEMPVYTSSRTGLYPQSSYFDNRELQNDGEYGVVPVGFFVYRHMSDDSTFKFNINKVGNKIAVSKEYPVFTTNKMDSGFLLDYLNNGKQFKAFAVMQKQGGTRTRLYFKKLITLKLPTPSLKEQQKIASFLSKVDEKIALLTEKKDKLTEYKKGVMQQLFNGKWEKQGGQLTFIPPTLRFKADDGSEFPDWEEYKKQIKIVAGNAYKADEYSDSGYLLIQGQNIFPDELRLDETPKHISSKSSNHTTIIKGDIVLGLNRPITNGKLKTCRYPISNPSVLYQRAGKLEFNADEVDSEFLFQYITSPEFMRQLKLELVGSDQPYIKSNLFGVTKNIFPSIDEQRKISSFLASLNIKLDLVNSELEKAKEWKKGLLQQMFV